MKSSMGGVKRRDLRPGWAEVSGTFVKAYRRFYAARRDIFTAPVPVISVGGLTMGGSGKTPFAELVARRLRARGYSVAVVSRGYGRCSRGIVVVADGGGPKVDVQAAGDEPYLMAQRNPVIVVVGVDRVAAADRAAGLGATVVVLDDGFQHRRLHRDADLVLLPSGPLPLVLPFGPGREPPSALARADLRVGLAGQGDVSVVVVPEPWITVDGAAVPPPRRVVLVTGIARPGRVARTVRDLGVVIADHVRFRDHHWWTPDQIRRLERRARSQGADGLATTEKDAVRWPVTPGVPTWVLPIRLEVAAGASALDAVLDRATGGA